MANKYDPYNASNYNGANKDTEGGDLKYVKKAIYSHNLTGIFGIPYQFMASVDRRLSGDKRQSSEYYIGRKYAQKIFSRMPILLLTPCRQKFLEGYKRFEQGKILSMLTSGGAFSDHGELSKTGKYYSTEFAYNQYYNMVGKLANQVLYFLGLGETEVNIGGKRRKLANTDWMQEMTNDGLKGYFAASRAVMFFLDGFSQITDSFSNSTTEPALASTINGFSDTAKEIMFLLGDNSALGQLLQSAGNGVADIAGALTSATQGLTGDLLADLSSTAFDAVLHGGKIIFPKIWNTSEYSRSYTFDIKLRSPDHDKLSIFLNIILPYLYLLALALPQSNDDQNPNIYESPFLVKAYCKGMFNIDMGIISELSVTRGAQCQWSDDGLPTQIDVQLSIEDLYSSLVLTKQVSKGHKDNADMNFITKNWDVVSNTGMVDFLANLSGLNVAAEEIGRRERMYVYLTGHDINKIPSKIYNYFDNALQNINRRIHEFL